MLRTKGRMRLCTALLILNLAFIWGNSLLPGDLSAALSQWVKDLIAAIFGSKGDPHAGHGLLRKLAHFTEFCCLGMCLTWLNVMLGKSARLSFLLGFLVACTDEIIQCFIPDRGPAVKDVLIDTMGVTLGIGLLLAGHAIYHNKKLKQNLEENKL